MKSRNFSISELDKSIDYAATYIKTNLNNDGRFIYEKDAISKIIYGEKRYNILRHAGMLYAISLYEKYSGDKEFKSIRCLAAKYLLKNYVKELSNGNYVVVSNKKEEKLPFNQVKLGAVALTLAGISDLNKENIVSDDILVGLGNFIVSMQKDNGSFYSKYNYDKNKVCEDFVSICYPGEAAFGLLCLNESIPDKKWVDCACKALIYLAETNKNSDEVLFDYWAVQAIEKLFKIENNGLSVSDREILDNFIQYMAEIALEGQITDNKNLYRGAKDGNISPCSIASYIEGETTIFKLTNDDKLKTRLLRSIMFAVDFVASSQIKEEGETFGGIPSIADYELENSESRASAIRIDNVQHAISALIKYRMLFK